MTLAELMSAGIRFDTLAKLDAYRTLESGVDQLVELVAYRTKIVAERPQEMGIVTKQIREQADMLRDAIAELEK